MVIDLTPLYMGVTLRIPTQKYSYIYVEEHLFKIAYPYANQHA